MIVATLRLFAAVVAVGGGFFAGGLAGGEGRLAGEVTADDWDWPCAEGEEGGGGAGALLGVIGRGGSSTLRSEGSEEEEERADEEEGCEGDRGESCWWILRMEDEEDEEGREVMMWESEMTAPSTSTIKPALSWLMNESSCWWAMVICEIDVLSSGFHTKLLPFDSNTCVCGVFSLDEDTEEEEG